MGVRVRVSVFSSILQQTLVTLPISSTDAAISADRSAMERLLVLGFILSATSLAKFSVTAYESDCAKDNPSDRLGLRNLLFCDYDPYLRPGDPATTIVKLQLIPKFIEFDDSSSSTLIVHSLMTMSWTDPHLSWRSNPKFSGIQSLHVSSQEIWTPDITVYNFGSQGAVYFPTTPCLVRNNGTVTCTPVMSYMTRCAPNYQHWPFDTQSCILRLGSWAHRKAELDYQLIGTGVNMVDYTESLEWKVLSVNITKGLLPIEGLDAIHPSVIVDIVIERHSTSWKATIVAPAILLIIMTLTVLWLDPMTVERMILAGLNLICHMLAVMDLNWQVPFSGATTPSILIFHQNSMMIASVAFFLTALLRQLKEMSLPAPVWLISTTSLILESRAGQFVLLTSLDPKATATLDTVEGDNSGLVQSNSSSPKSNPGISAWHHFATLIDRVSFAGIVFTYVIMLAVLIPKNDFKDG